MQEPVTALDPLTLTGFVVDVFVGDQLVGSTWREEIELRLDGIVGDRHQGTSRKLGPRDGVLKRFGLSKGMPLAPTRQVSIVSAEELSAIEQALNTNTQIPFGALGENIVISRIPRLTELPPGTLLCFQRDGVPKTAVIFVTGENTPCIIAGKEVEAATETQGVASRFVDAAMGRRGLVGFVHASGTVRKGDRIVVHVPPQRLYRP